MDKGKAKMSEYEDDDNESTHSLDSEFGGFNVPIGVKKALTSANEKLCRSTREKNLVRRFGYNDYMAYDYAFMIRWRQFANRKPFPKKPRIHDGSKP